jgi:MoaA/NifB/PqqE/SkfB family radical SAM enzyme
LKDSEVADIAGPYSSLKILHHPERIAALKRGEQIVPTHLEMVLSDLCNHDCSWCLVGDTLIDTPGGQRRIDSLREGDQVNTPLGGVGEVRTIGSREVSEVMEVTISGGRRLLVTAEHPILTQDGYKPAGELREGDSAAVSVYNESTRVREVHADITNERGIPRAATMQVWLRESSKAVEKDSSEVLGALPSASFCERKENVGRQQEGQLRANEVPQSDEGQGHGRESEPENKRQDAEQVGGWIESNLGCGQKENAFGQESHEGNGRPPQGNGEDFCAQSAVQERNSLSGLVRAKPDSVGMDGQCAVMDWEEEPRLSSPIAEEGSGGYAKGDVQQQVAQENARQLRDSGRLEIPSEEMAVLGSVQRGSSGQDSAGTKRSHGLLYRREGMLERCLVLRQIVRVRRLLVSVRVYNLSIEPFEAYIANGIVVHNCAYRWTGYTSNELFAKDVPLAQFGTNNPMRMMRKEKALEIIDDMVEMGIGALEATGGGEPTVHPDCVEIMKYALDKGLDVALVSNGELFRPGHIENLLRCKWVRFSLDAATPEVYAANRRIKGERMQRVTDNIKELTEARKKYIAEGNKCDLIIGIGFVLNKENWWEVAEAAKLAKELGADNIRISAVFQPDDDAYFAGFYEEAVAKVKEARAYDGDGFRVFDNFGERYQDLVDKNPSHSFCGYQQFTTYVGADESVFRCCLLAYSERGTIGSLKNQRLKDLWASEQKKNDFDTFDATKCERCMFSSKLRTILYAIDPNPMHANFV